MQDFCKNRIVLAQAFYTAGPRGEQKTHYALESAPLKSLGEPVLGNADIFMNEFILAYPFYTD